MAIQALAVAAYATQEGFESLKHSLQEFNQQMLSTVALFRPIQIELFERSLKDLGATFGQMLLPAVEKATQMFGQLADYVYSLPQDVKDFVSSLAEVAAELAVVASVATGIAAVGAALIAVVNPAGLVIATLTKVGMMFSETAGGAQFLSDALQYIEGGFAALGQTVQAAWDMLAPVRAEFEAALSDLGETFSQLLDAVKPLASGALAAFGLVLKEAAGVAIEWMTNLARSIQSLGDVLIGVVRRIEQFLGIQSANLFPDTSRPKKDATGLGWGGGSVTTPEAFYKQIQEEIFRSSRPDTPETKMPDNIEAIKTSIKNIEERLIQYFDAAKTATTNGPAAAIAGAEATSPIVKTAIGVGRILLGI